MWPRASIHGRASDVAQKRTCSPPLQSSKCILPNAKLLREEIFYSEKWYLARAKPSQTGGEEIDKETKSVGNSRKKGRRKENDSKQTQSSSLPRQASQEKAGSGYVLTQPCERDDGKEENGTS